MKQIALAALVALTLTTTTFAQRGRPDGPPLGPPNGGSFQQGQRPNPIAALKAALDLTDAQITAIGDLNTARQQTIQAIRAEIDQSRQAFETQLNAAAPNPTSVGTAAIALRTSENKLKAERDSYLAQVKNLLTVTQQETLAKLIAAGAPLPGLGGAGPGGPGFGGPGRGGPRPPQ